MLSMLHGNDLDTSSDDSVLNDNGSQMQDIAAKYDDLQQSTQLLAREKEEFLFELQRLKTSNTELTERNLLLESLQIDTEQQANLLTTELHHNTSILDDEFAENQQLRESLQHHIQIVHKLSTENKSLSETNQKYSLQLESLTARCNKLETESAEQLQQHNAKTDELQSQIVQLHQVIQHQMASRTSIKCDDDEEKSAPTAPGLDMLREKTLEIKSHGMLSERGVSTHSLNGSMHKISIPFTDDSNTNHNNPSRRGSVSRAGIYSLDHGHYSEPNSPLLTNEYFTVPGMLMDNYTPSHAHKSSSKTTAMQDYEKQCVFLQEQLTEKDRQLNEQKLAYESMLNTLKEEIEAMKKELDAKEAMVKSERKRLWDDWYKEKQILMTSFEESTKQIQQTYMRRVDALQRDFDCRGEQAMKFMDAYNATQAKYHELCEKHRKLRKELSEKRKQIKRLRQQNEELREVVNKPASPSNCYSVAKWFK